LTSNEIFSLAIVGILTADVYTENLLYTNALKECGNNVCFYSIFTITDNTQD